MSTLDDFGNYQSELKKLTETWVELKAAEKNMLKSEIDLKKLKIREKNLKFITMN